MIENLVEFVEIAHFDLYLQLQALLFEVCVAAVDGLGDASSKVYVVVLEQYHVEQTYAMVGATAYLHGLLLKHTQSGSGLAGVEHACAGALKPLHITVGHGCNAAHSLHDIEHQALSLQQRAHLSRDNHSYVAGLHLASVAHEHLYLHRGIEAGKHFLGYFDTCQDAFFLYEKMRTALSILGNTTQCGMVAVADVLCKGQVDKLFFELVNT